MDKSKYPATQTVNGVTFTNNGDGTITANGTSSAEAPFTLGIPNIKKGHKYFFYGLTENGGWHKFVIFINTVTAITTTSGDIFTASKDSNIYQMHIYINSKNTVSNLVFKPQLFDLTEMYGAGNEPTTVEQFRQDFPEEMYDYSPHCFVKSYKNYLKVSNVCQLMVYPYFETTLTRAGITFTDNGDGTITANGTSVGFATFVFSKNFNFIAGNKYYVSTPYSIIAYKENGTIKYAQGNILFTWKSNWEIVQVYMQINKGITVSNLTFKPQIFDLTEMYGAGNEPTTVQQFKADFPNELYDYKPYSIITSYKKSLVCKTKNLFDKVGAALIKSDNSAAPVNWYSWKGSKIYINYGLYSYGLFFQPITLSAGTYTLSAMASMNDINGSRRYVSIGYKDNSNNSHTQYVIISSDNQKISYTFTLTEEAVIRINLQGIGSSSNYDHLDTSFWGIQLELGDTATDYVPYGHL